MSSQEQIYAEFSDVMRLFAASGRVATTIGGSRGKRRDDARSDFDFRVYADAFITEDWPQSPGYKPFKEVQTRWEAQGHRIDGFWPRKIADVDAALDRWSGGDIEPEPKVWTIWGYYLPTDIASQQAVEDPDGIVAAWHTRLAVYPPAAKAATLSKHLEFVRYWRDDYHYVSKVERGDAIFLAGLSAKIVHSLCQIVFALNEIYYPGDGWNQTFIEAFALAPSHFGERATACLYPEASPERFVTQRLNLIALMNEVEALIPSEAKPQNLAGKKNP